MKNQRTLSLLLFFCIAVATSLPAQKKTQTPVTPTPAPAAAEFNAGLYKGLKWRNIGPFRGGRSVAVSGVPGDENTYYAGYTGGGLWKTDDAGLTWRPIADGALQTGSVGDIAIAPSDPNVVYVGMGEHAPRGVMTFYGDGMYKSTDAGQTWKHLGLEKTRQIGRAHV